MRAAVPHRRVIAWLCVVATLLLGVAAQRHALQHAFQALQAPAHQDAWIGHAQACDQCLQFAAVDAAAVASAASPSPCAADARPAHAVQPAPRAERFAAYGSRAPPRVG